MASGNIIVIPSNGANMIQMAPGLASVALQASGVIPYPLNGAQQLGISTSAPQQGPQKGPLAIQIMIGLIHIGFGALCLIPYNCHILSGMGGYPFWGGIVFISSGSLCVSAVNRPNPALVKSSVGLNITSAVMALTGVILSLFDLISNYMRHCYQCSPDSLLNISYSLSCVLLLFSLLEFCIAVSLAHFGCQATCCSDAQPTVLYVPYQALGGGKVTAEPNPPPPTDNMVTNSQ